MRFNQRSSSCTPFALSRAACQKVPANQRKTREQINTITAFVDGSHIYGNSRNEEGDKIRKFDGKSST